MKNKKPENEINLKNVFFWEIRDEEENEKNMMEKIKMSFNKLWLFQSFQRYKNSHFFFSLFFRSDFFCFKLNLKLFFFIFFGYFPLLPLLLDPHRHSWAFFLKGSSTKISFWHVYFNILLTFVHPIDWFSFLFCFLQHQPPHY